MRKMNLLIKVNPAYIHIYHNYDSFYVTINRNRILRHQIAQFINQRYFFNFPERMREFLAKHASLSKSLLCFNLLKEKRASRTKE